MYHLIQNSLVNGRLISKPPELLLLPSPTQWRCPRPPPPPEKFAALVICSLEPLEVVHAPWPSIPSQFTCHVAKPLLWSHSGQSNVVDHGGVTPPYEGVTISRLKLITAPTNRVIDSKNAL